MKFKDILLQEEDLESKWKELAVLLNKHDWMYAMTSDNRAYKKGEEEEKKIRELKNKLIAVDRERLIKTYKENIPKHIQSNFTPGWDKNLK